MSDKQLPYGWIEATISEIADINPKKIDAAPETVAGFVPMSHAPTNYSDNLKFEEKYWSEIKKSYTNFREHDVLVAKVTPCFENGKAAIVKGLPNKIGAGSSEFYVIRPAIQEISSRFLFSIVKSYKFLSEGAANMTGAVGLRRVPRSFVETFPVLVPPLAEQKAIADKIDTLLAQVETTKARLERIPEILKSFRQSVLTAAMSGKLTDKWRKGKRLDARADLASELRFTDCKKRKTEPTSFHDLVEDMISSSWALSKFDDLYRFIDYRGKTPRKSQSGKRLYTAKNIKMGYLSDEPVEYISEQDYDSWMTRGKSKLNDIFFVTEGHTMGCVALNGIGSDIALAQRTLTLQPYGQLISKFHYYFMLTEQFQKVVDLNATGTAAKGIKAAKFRGLPVPFPAYDEQIEIVSRVDVLFGFADSIEQKANEALERVDKLTQSILAQAFKGELTATWREANPDLLCGENSAEALLEKIKAEREALKPVRKSSVRKKS